MSHKLKQIIFCIFTILAFSPAFAGDSTIEDKIDKLNSASIESLGISLNALSYLVQISPESYIPLSHLKKSGKIHHIDELEKAGYVKISKRVGLPDGRERSETFLNVRPVKTGKKIQKRIQKL